MPTGHSNFRTSLVKLLQKYHPETLTSNWRDVFSTEPSEILDVWMSDAYQGPRMRIHQMEIAGPEPRDESTTDLLADKHQGSLKPFLFRAFPPPTAGIGSHSVSSLFAVTIGHWRIRRDRFPDHLQSDPLFSEFSVRGNST